MKAALIARCDGNDLVKVADTAIPVIGSLDLLAAGGSASSIDCPQRATDVRYIPSESDRIARLGRFKRITECAPSWSASSLLFGSRCWADGHVPRRMGANSLASLT